MTTNPMPDKPATPSPGAMRAAERCWNEVVLTSIDDPATKADCETFARIIDAETGAAEAWALLREWRWALGKEDTTLAYAKALLHRIDAALARHEGDKA